MRTVVENVECLCGMSMSWLQDELKVISVTQSMKLYFEDFYLREKICIYYLYVSVLQTFSFIPVEHRNFIKQNLNKIV